MRVTKTKARKGGEGGGGERPRGWPADKGTSSEGSGGYKVELLVLHDRKVVTCCAICIIPCVTCLPYLTVLFNKSPSTYVKGELNHVFPRVCRLLAMRWSVEEYFRSHSTDYKKRLEISHRNPLERLKPLLKWPISASLSLESDKNVTAEKHWSTWKSYWISRVA